jgi:hypothetical protein
MPTHGSRDGSSSESTETGTKRRDFVKFAGVASAGALGTLAGCAGSDGGGGGTDTATDTPTETDSSDGGGGGTDTATATESGSEGPAVVKYWSSIAAETPPLNKYYKKKMREFEEIKNKETLVDIQALSHSNLKTKFVTTIEAGGGVPDLALSGSFGLQQYRNGNVIDHGPYIEETEGLPDNWTNSQVEAGQYRGEWWAAGTATLGNTMSTIVNEPFKQIGISNPHEELQTWTDFRRALIKVGEETDYDFPYEVTGVEGDVEAYWGSAHTAYTDGTDPWMDVEDQGSPDNPYIKVDGTDRTDGMIYNEIELGEEFSSPKHPTRGDEGVYPLMLNGKIASHAYGGSVRAIKAQAPNATFGWDGMFTGIATPRVDPNYGEEFDIPELAGKEGNHGGHTWSLETQKTIQEASEVKDAAWELAKFTLIDERFLIPLLVDPGLNQSVPTYEPMIEVQRQDKYKDMRTQPFEKSLELLEEHGGNFATTGAAWDIPGTNTIRWSDIGGTLSKAYADDFSTEEAPAKIKENMVATLEDNGIEPKNP